MTKPQDFDLKALTLPPEQVAAGQAAYAKRRALARIPGVSDEDAVEAEWRAEITADEDAEELASIHAEDAPAPEPEDKLTAEEELEFDLAMQKDD